MTDAECIDSDDEVEVVCFTFCRSVTLFDCRVSTQNQFYDITAVSQQFHRRLTHLPSTYANSILNYT